MSYRDLLLSLLLLAFACSPCRAAIWNPLAKAKPSPVGMNRSNKKPGIMKTTGHVLAQHLPSFPSELVAKTKHILPSSPAKPKTHGHNVSRLQKKDEKPSLFKSLFVSQPTPPPRTVGEWMSLKRLDP